MMHRRVNFVAIVILLVVCVGLGVAVHVVHGVQVKRNAGEFLFRADRAETEGRPRAAADCLGAYLRLRPDDADARTRFGLLLARLAESPRERQEACTVLEQVVQANNTRDDVRRELARHYLVLRRFPEAKAHLEMLPNDASTCLLLGRCEEGLEHPEQAAEWFSRATEFQPDGVEAYEERARLLRDVLRNPDSADDVIKQLLAVNSQSASANMAAARYYSKTGRFDAAEPYLQLALEKQHDLEPAVHAWASDLALARGDRNGALARLQTGVGIHPADVGLRLALARLELQLGLTDEALQTIRPLYDAPPNRIDDLVLLTGLLIDLHQFQHAAEGIERLRGQVAPAVIGFLSAHFLAKQNEWGQARALLLDAIPGLTSADWRLQANLLLAKCYEHLGNWDGELAAYDGALRTDRRNVAANAGKSGALLRLGRLDDAVNSYRGVVAGLPELAVPMIRLLIMRNLRLAPNDRDWTESERTLNNLPVPLQKTTDAIIVRAELLAAKGHVNDAFSTLGAERERRPEQLAAWLALVELNESQGRNQEATSLLDQAAERFSDHVELTMARIRLASRQPRTEALKVLATFESRVNRLSDPDQNRVLAALGDAHSQLGDTPGAVKFWKQLATRTPKNLAVRIPLFAVAVRNGDDVEMDRLLQEIRQIEGKDGGFSAYGEAARLVTHASRGDRSGLGRARELASVAAAQRPSWAAVALLQAQIEDLQDQPVLAMDHYLRAVEMGVRQPEIIRRTVALLYQRGRYADAQRVLDQIPASAVLESGMGRHSVALTLLTTKDTDESRQRAFGLARSVVSSDSNDLPDLLWLGQVAVAAGKFSEAEQLFRRAIALEPTSPDSWMALVFMLVNSDPSRAPAVMEEAARSISPEKAALALAPGYEKLGQLDKAQRQYEIVLAAKPNDPNVLSSVAGFYARTAQLPKAEACLRTLLQLPDQSGERGHAWARRHLAVTLAGSGVFAKFNEAIHLLAKNHPPTLDDERSRGVVLATQPMRRDEAIAILESVHERAALPPGEAFVLVRLYVSAGNRNKALQHLVNIVRVERPQPEHVAYHIEFLLKGGHHGAAQGWLPKLDELKPDPFLAMSMHAKCAHENQSADAAVGIVLDFVKRHPASSSSAALLLEELGRPIDAESLYRTMSRTGPAGALRLVKFLGRVQRIDEALSLCEPMWNAVPAEAVADACLSLLRSPGAKEPHFQKVADRLMAALEKNPSSPLLNAFHAELLFHSKRYAESIAAYRRVLELDPNNAVAANLLAWMLALTEGKGTEALAFVQRAIDLVGPRPELLDTRAIVYLTLNQPENALKDMQDVVRISPSPSAYFHLALAYHKAKDHPRTKESFSKASELGLSPENLHPLEVRAYDDLVAALTE
jgi:tetratricopeptide (TPR) repeat protein